MTTLDVTSLCLAPLCDPSLSSYYVTWFSLSRNDNARALVIGNGNPSNNGGTTYINRLLEPGQYYVFVRLYNDVSVCVVCAV